MAITHEADVRNGLADYVVDQLNGGKVEFQTTGSAKVAEPAFGSPAFGDAAAGAATANAIAADTNAVGGTISKFVLKRSAGTVMITGTVGTSGADINITSLAIGAGDTVEVDSLTYEASA